MSRWIPLESNPEVLNSWSIKAGLVTSQDQFSDVYGLDPELLAMVPQPVKAIIVLFPITDLSESKRKEEDAKLAKEGQPTADSTVLWIKQTIDNACGTIGLLHALANSNVTIVPESPLAKFIDECQDKSPEQRAKLLETTELFANIHADAALTGQTAPPNADSKTNLHFTCFVQAPSSRNDGHDVASMRVLELDGRRNGPIDRGECIDFLTDVAKILKETYVAYATSLEFSMLSLGPSP